MENHVLEKEIEKNKIDFFKIDVQKLEQLAGNVQTSVSNEEISKRVKELKKELSLISMNSKEKENLRKNLNTLPKKRKLLESAKETLLKNGYELVVPIGKGAFGQVYRARVIKDTQEELKIGDDVAVKLINLEIVDKKDMHSYVHSEIQIHSMLDHPFVLKLFDHFRDDYNHFLILAFCSNGDVRKLLEKKGKLSEDQAYQMFNQILHGIVYLHENNIVHRDLKPGNLLLDEYNNIKIADFGLAKQLDDDKDRHTTKCGTPGYMAPEVGDKPYRKEVDIYSLGCLLYNLVIGNAPPNKCSESYLKTRIAHLSSHLQNLLFFMLRENPKNRIKLHEISDHPFVKRNSQLFSKSTTHSKDSGFGSSNKTSNSRSSNSANESNPFEAIMQSRPAIPLKNISNINPENIHSGGNVIPRFGKTPLSRPEKKKRPIDALKAKIRALPPCKTDFDNYEHNHCKMNNHESEYQSEEYVECQNNDHYNPHHQNYNDCNRNDVLCERKSRSASPHNSNGCRDTSMDRLSCSQCGNSLSTCNRSDHPCIHNNHCNVKQNKCHRSTSPCGQHNSTCSHNGHCPANNVCSHENTCQCHQNCQQCPTHDSPEYRTSGGDNRIVHTKNQTFYGQPLSGTISKFSAAIKKPEFFSVLYLGESEKCYRNKVFRASILSTREVCMEFFGKNKYCNKVVTTYLISSDGMHVKVYNFGRHGIEPSECPPSIPGHKNFKIPNNYFTDYHYNDLPEKYWTAYLYASKYVKNCKGRTPGVIFYSNKAKAVLMLDFITCEITFYDGTNFLKRFETIEMLSTSGVKKTFNYKEAISSLSTAENEKWDHASELEKNCHSIPKLVDKKQFPPFFPVVCGRKPNHMRKTSKNKSQENVAWTSNASSTNTSRNVSLNLTCSNFPSSSDQFERRVPLKSSQNMNYGRTKHQNTHEFAQRLRRI